MNADGSGQRNLCAEPVVSGVGRRLVARRSHDPLLDRPRRQLGDLRHERRRKQPTKPDAESAERRQIGGSAWSPDGRTIVFASTRDTRDQDHPELYVMNADGSNVRRLTRSPGVETVLSWSPDGRKLAFQRFPAKPRWAFFVMNADGSGVRKVTWSLPGKAMIASRAVSAVAACTWPRSGAAPARAGTRPADRRTRSRPAGREPVVLTLVTGDELWASEFAAAVKRLSGGTIQIDIRAGGDALLDYERRHVENVRAGKADLVSVGARAWDRLGVTSFQALVAPFLVDSVALERRVLESPLVERMLEGVEPLDLVGLAVLPGLLRRPFGLSRPLLGPDDYAGATFGIRYGGVARDTIEALGATAKGYRSAPWLDSTAPSSTCGRSRVTATTRPGQLTANVVLWARPETIVIGRKAFDRLPSAQQEILRRAGRETLAPMAARLENEQQSVLEAAALAGSFRSRRLSRPDRSPAGSRPAGLRRARARRANASVHRRDPEAQRRSCGRAPALREDTARRRRRSRVVGRRGRHEAPRRSSSATAAGWRGRARRNGSGPAHTPSRASACGSSSSSVLAQP